MNIDSSLNNPFGEPSFDNQSQFDQSFPVCHDNQAKNGQIRNTPISRFSETNHSNSKATDLQFDEITSHFQQVVQQGGDRMTKITMTVQQLAKVYTLHEAYSDLKCHIQVLEQRNQQMAIQLEKQRVKTSHFQKTLNLIKKQDQNILKELTQKTEKNMQAEQRLSQLNHIKQKIQQQFNSNKVQNAYLKELIMIANNNYEGLEKKYENLLTEKHLIEAKLIEKQKQSYKNADQLKAVLLELMNNVQGAQPKEILNNKTSLKNIGVNRSNYSSNKQTYVNNHKSINNRQNIPKDNLLANKQNIKKTLPSTVNSNKLKSPTNISKGGNEEMLRNFFVKTLKGNQ